MVLTHDRPYGSHAAASVREAAAQGFDPLSDVLRTVRLSGAMFFMVEASDPWGIEVPAAERYAGIVMPGAQHVVSYHLMLDGTGWVRMPGLEPARFSAGDVLVFAHSDPYQMLSAPDRRPETGKSWNRRAGGWGQAAGVTRNHQPPTPGPACGLAPATPPLAVEQDESLGPEDIGILGPDAVMQPSRRVPGLVEELDSVAHDGRLRDRKLSRIFLAPGVGRGTMTPVVG